MPLCSFCKVPASEANSVDQTNGPNQGQWILEQTALAKTHQCTCGHVHVTEPARFKLKYGPDGRPERLFVFTDDAGKEHTVKHFLCKRCGEPVEGHYDMGNGRNILDHTFEPSDEFVEKKT